MNLSVSQVRANTKKSDGIFFPSCLAHGVAESTTIQGASYPALVGDWFWEQNKLPHRLSDTCDNGDGLPCNPSCPGATPHPPAGQCRNELEQLCRQSTTKQACVACAEQHAEALEAAGEIMTKEPNLCIISPVKRPPQTVQTNSAINEHFTTKSRVALSPRLHKRRGGSTVRRGALLSQVKVSTELESE